ncbi:MAG TPA: CHAP domain-containing protein [Acidimicrobiales bacterium]|nr:CHAP domain-containing protein [Acidimicrobiales bacterium]
MSVADRVIRTARGEVGYHEGRTDGHWDNKEKYAAEVPTLAWVNAGGYAWCAVFVCWCFNKVGALDLIPGGATASVAHFRDSAKAAGRFSEYPARGAIILYGQNGDAHTGIVVDYDDTTVTTIEGNTNTDGSAEGDGVYKKTHARTDAWVYGYAYPTYAEPLDSADPKWQEARVAEPKHQAKPTRISRAKGLLRKAKDHLKKHGARFKRIAKALHVLPRR